MEKKVILKAEDLNGYLTDEDHKNISEMNKHYSLAIESFRSLSVAEGNSSVIRKETDKIIKLYDIMGDFMKEITSKEDSIRVYSFETPQIKHGEVSRLIAKLRDLRTPHDEFVYYVQRAYELLFNLAYDSGEINSKNHLIVKTPVTVPVQNYAVHKIPDVDDAISNSVMCVMLRGALLPSMILSKEIQEYSSTGYVTPFALFKIKRDESRMKHNMEYILDLEKSFFDPESLHGKDLIFADPMNATGGSLVTIVKYILKLGVKPRSIRFLNVISALKGTLQIIRSIEDITCYTLWLDPVLNDAAYILPGLGDAGDRLNGKDQDEYPRNMIQLIADYGTTLANLYRSQVRTIEQTILGN
ncbi:uracil phosphoribosyltransferase [Oceanispirochaeta sp.]|jgi:uracil phosphoribosyltransferase|uniref:uracil phosphoribosyltransferase n=1 Tax=Oceanispirochaeta sp. TaxID=2035350 RepID=UPI0026021679|nr:uracil phosphoribosyltransferase [Oceanispirochaeta sp.]MDA3958154.1 uracil phosphoribosyltransferase [Oceanispirochaeta sp.]